MNGCTAQAMLGAIYDTWERMNMYTMSRALWGPQYWICVSGGSYLKQITYGPIEPHHKRYPRDSAEIVVPRARGSDIEFYQADPGEENREASKRGLNTVHDNCAPV